MKNSIYVKLFLLFLPFYLSACGGSGGADKTISEPKTLISDIAFIDETIENCVERSAAINNSLYVEDITELVCTTSFENSQTISSFEDLLQFKALRNLSFGGMEGIPQSVENITSVGELTQLTHLTVGSVISLNSNSSPAFTITPTCWGTSSCPEESDVIESKVSLNTLVNLKTLDLSKTATIGSHNLIDLNDLSNLNKLTILKLPNYQFELAHIMHFEKLETLHLNVPDTSNINSFDILLTNSSNLKELILKPNYPWDPFKQSEHLNLNSVEKSISGLTKLHTLILPSFSPEDESVLEKLISLTRLEITYSHFTQDIFSHLYLSKLNKLEVLTLNSTIKTRQFIDQNGEVISRITCAGWVNSCTEVVPVVPPMFDDLSILSDLRNLKNLTINNIEILDITSLTQLTELEVITFENSALCKDIEALRIDFPTAEIITSDCD